MIEYTGRTLKYSPDQPRVPAGNPDGGEWAPGGGRDANTDAKKPASQFSISKNGIDFIAQHEGFKPNTYLDAAGHPTIGYGHRLQPGESYTNGITQDQAQQLLEHHVINAEDAVRDNVTVDLTQNQFDALTSLTYNIGKGNFENSTLLQQLNQGNYNGAADQFLAWNKVTINGIKVPNSGLTNRRRDERNLFLFGRH